MTSELPGPAHPYIPGGRGRTHSTTLPQQLAVDRQHHPAGKVVDI